MFLLLFEANSQPFYDEETASVSFYHLYLYHLNQSILKVTGMTNSGVFVYFQKKHKFNWSFCEISISELGFLKAILVL